MRSIALSLFLLSLVCCKTSLKPTQDLEEEGLRGETDGEICVVTKTDRKIGDTFPFNSSDSIVVISYSDFNERVKDIQKSPIINGSIEYDSIIERIYLNRYQIESLFNLLYSYRLEGGRNVGMCYSPRHSIVFYKAHKPIEVFEVCLDCLHYNTASKTDFGDFCQLKFCALEKYFKSIGITYGFEESRCE